MVTGKSELPGEAAKKKLAAAAVCRSAAAAAADHMIPRRRKEKVGRIFLLSNVGKPKTRNSSGKSWLMTELKQTPDFKCSNGTPKLSRSFKGCRGSLVLKTRKKFRKSQTRQLWSRPNQVREIQSESGGGRRLLRLISSAVLIKNISCL